MRRLSRVAFPAKTVVVTTFNMTKATRTAARSAMPGRAARRAAPTAAFALVLALASVFALLLPCATAAAAEWSPSAEGGLDGSYRIAAYKCSCMAAYGNRLYVGTYTPKGCGVWRQDDSGWTQVNTPGFGASDHVDATEMAVFGDRLYVGTGSNESGCRVWSYDGASWACVVGPGGAKSAGFGNAQNGWIHSMAVYNNKLYVATGNLTSGAELWSTPDGASWSRVDGGLLGAKNTAISSMKVFGGFLYAGTINFTAGCEVWRYNVFNWNQVASGGFGDPNNKGATSMEEYAGRLYVGITNYTSGLRVYSTDGVGPWLNADGGQLGPQNTGAYAMRVYNGNLYVGTSGREAQVWRYNGASWGRVDAGVMADNAAVAASMQVFGGKLYVGNGGETACEVWRYGSSWELAAPRGFSPNANCGVESMVSLGGYLYAGTESVLGCEVWRCDGMIWQKIAEEGFGDLCNNVASAMAAYKGELYVGTTNQEKGCEAWRYRGGAWEKIGTGGFGDPHNVTLTCLAEYGGKLYAGTANWTAGGEVWAWDGASWKLANAPGFGDANYDYVSCMAVYEGRLYAAIDGPNGCRIWSTAGAGGFPHTDWRQENADGFGKADNYGVESMAIHAGMLYAGTGNDVTGCEVWAFDGSSWKQAGAGGFGDAKNYDATSMASHDGRLWVGTFQSAWGGGTGCEIWSTTGEGGFPHTDWRQENPDGFGDKNTERVSAMAVYFAGLFVGVDNFYQGCSVWNTGSNWYLAEGATDGGFETWVLVQNPGTDPVHVDFTLNTGGGEQKPPDLQGVEIGAGSRRSFNLGSWVTDYNVSTKVSAKDGLVICERAMYWTPPGQATRTLGHDSVGVTSPAAEWYLAEGATDGGFETWVLVQNPGTDPVHVDFTLNTGGGEQKPPDLQGVEIGAGSRRSFNLGSWVTDYNVSTKVSAKDGLVICERAMYWTPPGQDIRTLGHDSVGFLP